MNTEEENKVSILNILFGFIKFIAVIFLILFISVVLVQKFTDSKTDIMGFRLFTVDGKSMSPDYKDGDVLLIKRIDSEYLIKGDDISYINDDVVVETSRITDIYSLDDGTVEFVIKDINEDTEDVIKDDQIYGKVTYKFIFISLLAKLASNMVSLIVTIVVPLLVIIILNLKDIIVIRNKTKKDIKRNKLAKSIEDNIEEDLNSEDDDDDDEDAKARISKFYE